MRWNKFKIKTTTQATDYVCGLLAAFDITSVEIEDNIQLSEEDSKKQYVDILADLPEDDGTAYVIFYTDDDVDIKDLLEKIEKSMNEARDFLDVGEATIEQSTTEEEDWINNWKEHFKAFEVGDFYIKPSWEELDDEYKNKHVIEIDPGTAFGTGQHDTTQLCIKELIDYVKPGMKVLDLGCGSGILGIAAKKLNAGRVDLIDIDENAIPVASDNFTQNNIDKSDVNFIVGNVLEDKSLMERSESEKYDIVVANILADVIIPIAGIVDRFLDKDGIFISSGIIDMKEKEVVDAIDKNENLELVDVKSQGEWRAVVAKKSN
ncbi:MAG: 50S ribosomal protein L11 methyltransferase [Eubacterium sp.]|nr:50S ribosomal protein L11 methyltransferase [Eubacterium sp.]